MASRPDQPNRGGLGPEESDTPPDDLPDLPNVPDDGDLPHDGGLLEPDSGNDE
jgi:hypothetical protein